MNNFKIFYTKICKTVFMVLVLYCIKCIFKPQNVDAKINNINCFCSFMRVFVDGFAVVFAYVILTEKSCNKSC